MKSINYLLIIILLLPFFISQAQNREIPPVTLDKISEKLYQILGGRGANGGMYIGDNEVLIIDSKMDKASVDGIFDAVKTVTDKPITLLINTHSDGDHINGNQFFPEAVTTIAHENCRKDFFHSQRNGSPSIWLDEKMKPFAPEVTFNDKMKLYLGSKTVELYYFGIGHTTGDIVVYFPEEKTAFIGDQVFFGRPQLIHSYKGGNSFKHVKTTEKFLTLDAEKFCSGHAEIKGREDIEQHIKNMVDIQNKIKKQIKSGQSLDEIKSGFAENEGRLVETIYNEINAEK
ncbi:MAG: MBL fold metallo-hydrolase [Bacteroidota bacterium]